MSELPADPACWMPSLRERYEERAAILEFDAGFSRDEAEARAEKAIRREQFTAEMRKLRDELAASRKRGTTYAGATGAD